ncbi:hypothetical protein D3C85_1388210 [compost metagenome]
MLASAWAWRALSAFCCTVTVSSSMLAAVCAREAACCSVRDDRSTLPLAICAEPLAMLSLLARTEPTSWVNESCIRCIAWVTLPGSARDMSMRAVRSPLAMLVARSATAAGSPPSWRVRPRVRSTPISTPASRPAAVRPIISRRMPA